MVAITVILAAVIGSFVFGMGPGEKAPTINFRASGEVDGSNSIITLEVLGGDKVDVSDLNFTVDGDTESPATGSDTDTAAGNEIILKPDGTDSPVTVRVIDEATNAVIFQADVSVA